MKVTINGQPVDKVCALLKANKVLLDHVIKLKKVRGMGEQACRVLLEYDKKRSEPTETNIAIETVFVPVQRLDIPEDCTECFYCKTASDFRKTCRYGLSAGDLSIPIDDTKKVCTHFRIKGKHE